ncbi:MAG: cupin domain-containing protein [Acidobacteria bacterium]|nr:cupin domain-containing protein [Acidobacteriota bacterium]
MKFTVDEMLAKLPLPANDKWVRGVWDLEAISKDGISLILFAPREVDFQTFHEEDEFYFVVRGSGELLIADERFSCEIGDVFFVPSRVEHHFENFTADFATWAIFF